MLGATAEDDLALETLGIRGFASAGLGASVMHDSRDNQDMPMAGWFLNVNNIAYRESLGGSATFDAYRIDLKMFWKHGRGHVLAVRQYNWLTGEAPVALDRSIYPVIGGGLQFVLKPVQRMNINLEYAQGVDDNRAPLSDVSLCRPSRR